ncbi:MAG: hypothetical protein RIS88_2987 [Pseudomonadota bacterium]|jgi:hypothetical protein
MALSSPAPYRPFAPPRDRPQVERAEHANLDRRCGAGLHPSARQPVTPLAHCGQLRPVRLRDRKA